jgi:hypothetical protein
MANSKVLGVVLFALSLGVGGSTALTTGCTGMGLEGSPYGETERSKPRKSTEATTAAEIGSRSTDNDNAAPAIDTAPSIPVDAGAADADSGSVPVLPANTCSLKTGVACEDCCVNQTSGGAAVDQRIGSEFDDCVFFEQCGGNDACEDFCIGMALDVVCQGGQKATCDAIDACVVASKCYR